MRATNYATVLGDFCCWGGDEVGGLGGWYVVVVVVVGWAVRGWVGWVGGWRGEGVVCVCVCGGGGAALRETICIAPYSRPPDNPQQAGR